MAMESILESISDGVFTVDKDWKITYFNRAAEQITGVDREEALGAYCYEVFKAGLCESNCPIKETFLTHEPVIGRGTFIINSAGEKILSSVSTAVVRDENGEIIGAAETFRNLSYLEVEPAEGKHSALSGGFVSRSGSMRKIIDVLPQVASSNGTILLQGETGTGKSMLAKVIHTLSPRKHKPFVELNCGALPESIVESELFGYKKGAFTGAEKDKPGRLQLANGGTLFLDEIGELSQHVQVKLLQFLQERRIEPLGGTEPVETDARIIVATNKNLWQEVQSGNFRQDLFYRIHVISFELPLLKDRREDIPVLTKQILQKLNLRHERSVYSVTPEAMSLLMQHDYPGNIRELENVIEHGIIMCQGNHINVEHLPTHILGVKKRVNPEHSGQMSKTIKNASDEFEKQAILEALERNLYSRKKTAADLGIHKTTLYRKMKKCGL